MTHSQLLVPQIKSNTAGPTGPLLASIPRGRSWCWCYTVQDERYRAAGQDFKVYTSGFGPYRYRAAGQDFRVWPLRRWHRCVPAIECGCPLDVVRCLHQLAVRVDPLLPAVHEGVGPPTVWEGAGHEHVLQGRGVAKIESMNCKGGEAAKTENMNCKGGGGGKDREHELQGRGGGKDREYVLQGRGGGKDREHELQGRATQY